MNFVGAETKNHRSLQEDKEFVGEVHGFCNSPSYIVKCKFIPNRTLHLGGLWQDAFKRLKVREEYRREIFI